MIFVCDDKIKIVFSHVKEKIKEDIEVENYEIFV
jgi:hypothetical protein